jgi:hypothetical protein
MELPTANVSTPAISLQTSKNTLSASYHLLERDRGLSRTGFELWPDGYETRHLKPRL